MSRLGILTVAGVRVPVVSRRLTSEWGEYDIETATITLGRGVPRPLLLQTLVHEVTHAAIHLYITSLEGRADEEQIAAAVGATMAQNWDELQRIARTAQVRQ